MSKTKKTIAVQNSAWSNIGNAFFQMSAMQMLSEALPNYYVVGMDDPAERVFRPRQFKKNLFDVRNWYDADHYVFVGPQLGSLFLSDFAEQIKAIVERNKSYSLLSMHSEAEGAELKRIKDFLQTYPPKAFHTRDHMTFDKLSGQTQCKLDGCCFAFFASYLNNIPKLTPDRPYICSSFYRSYEPNITIGNITSNDFLGCGIKVQFHNKSILPWGLSRHLEVNKKYPTELGNWNIVRPVHGFYPLPHLIFSRPQSYISYNPLNFLSIYKYCEGVVTDRVHAGVVTLSFGHPAYVVEVDSRFGLFEAGNVEKQGDTMFLRKVTLDQAYQKHFTWLQNDFAAAIAD